MSWSKRTRFEKAVLILGVLVVACVLIGYTIHLQSTNALEDYRKQLRAMGEKLDVNEFIPPRVPPEQNGAELLRQAAKLANFYETFFYTNPPPAMRIVAPGKAMIGWKQTDIRDSEGTNSWLEASALLLQCHFGLDLLRQATARPSLDFAPDYRQGAMLLLPHLSEIKRSAQLLSAAAVCDLERGDSAAAFTNVCMMLALERKWGNEPIVISQLVRIAMVQITVGPSWELLQSPDVSEKQLETLQADWGDLEFIRSAENAFVMERATEEITFTHLRGSNSPLESLSLYGADSGSSSGGGGSGNWLEDLQDYSKSVWRGTKLKSKEILWRVSWSYTDELHALQGQQVLLDTVRLVRTNGFYMDALAAQKKRLDELGFDKLEDVEGLLTLMTSDPADLDVRWIFTSSVLSLRSYINKLLYAETARQLAVTAIALKRYQLRHGTLPSELTALVPEFLPAVPRDPVDGQPLRYHLNADGTFLLYSIGEDAVDDGGDAKPAKNPKSRAWQRGRDWVWPQPATAQEIRDYENDRLTGKD